MIENKNILSLTEIESLMSGYWLSDLANFSAYIFESMTDINWVGFYLNDGQKLRLGPFCGKVACLEIPNHKGVCGFAYTEKKSVIVDDVDQFPNHIACDTRSKSEIVIPLYINQKLVGVLDVDSPTLARFTRQDQQYLEKALQIVSEKITSYTGIQYGYIFK
jgi:L-methionine (R)-S-oxide reductase